MRLKRDLKRHTSRTKAYQQPSIPQCFIAALDISDFCLYCEACSFSQLKYSKRCVSCVFSTLFNSAGSGLFMH